MNLDSRSLTVVGCGIKSISHLTQEVIAYIQESDKVFYLVNEPVIASWICEKNKNSENLIPFYKKFAKRNHSYTLITNHVLNALEKFHHVCFVIYGHPTVFATASLNASRFAKKAGCFVQI